MNTKIVIALHKEYYILERIYAILCLLIVLSSITAFYYIFERRTANSCQNVDTLNKLNNKRRNT